MADTINSLGGVVSRVVPSDNYQITDVVFQKYKAPLDSELNLVAQSALDHNRALVKATFPASGWACDSTSPGVYNTNKSYVNQFTFGFEDRPLTAIIDGYVIPIAGTDNPVSGNFLNWIKLPPPPSDDTRIDLVFLEVWRALVSPTPSTSNKPSSSTMWKYGNVLFGGTNLTDYTKDSTYGAQTTKRVQLQYRIRVVSVNKLALLNNPDGFLNSLVLAQANLSSPLENSRYYMSPSDHGLWLAGWSGDAPVNNVLDVEVGADPTNGLGTADGWVKAIPICAVFRKVNGGYSVLDDAKNHSINRIPTINSASGATTITDVATLFSDISSTTVTNIKLTATTSAGIPTSGSSLIKIDDEVLSFSSISNGYLVGVTRGELNTVKRSHSTGAIITLLAGRGTSVRPDGLFADEITQDDILDLRHTVNTNTDRNLLISTFMDLMGGNLDSTWKMDQQDSSCVGPLLVSTDRFSDDDQDMPGAYSIGESANGLPTVWSDAATPWRHHVVALKPHTAIVNVGDDVSAVDSNYTLDAHAINIIKQTVANKFSNGDVIRVRIYPHNVGGAQNRFVFPGGPTPITLVPLSDSRQYPGRGVNEELVSIWTDGLTTEHTQNTYYGTGSSADATLLAYNIDASTAIIDTPISPSSSSPFAYDEDMCVYISGAPAPTGDAVFDSSYRCYLRYTTLTTGGHGLSRRPEKILSVSILEGHKDLLLPRNNIITKTQPIQMHHSVHTNYYENDQPTLTACYVDPGSKTFMLTPWQQIKLYPLQVITYATMPITEDPSTGSFPNKDAHDPLGIWDNTRSIEIPPGIFPTIIHTSKPYVGIDVPVYPVQYGTRYPTNDGNFVYSGGINCFVQARSSQTVNSGILDYATSGSTWVTFMTHTVDDVPVATGFNRQVGVDVENKRIGCRVVTASQTPWGRSGIQFSTFHGIARLWAVYEVGDFRDNGTSTDETTREPLSSTVGKAVNLLRDDCEGVPLWYWLDAEEDGTFVLDESMVDITRSPNAIASFDSGKYVVEATCFGFSRGFLVGSTEGYATSQKLVVRQGAPGGVVDSDVWADRLLENGDVYLVTPGPVRGSAGNKEADIAVTYTRRPYQGDPITGTYDKVDRRGAISVAGRTAISTTDTYTDLVEPVSFEVMDSICFATTLGTGRIAGFNGNTVVEKWSILDSAYEYDIQSEDLPINFVGVAGGDYGSFIHPRYAGATTRLPMGRLFLDKNFVGQDYKFDGKLSNFAINVLSRIVSSQAQTDRDSIDFSDPQTVMVPGFGATMVLSKGVNTDTMGTQFRTYRGDTGSLIRRNGNYGPITVDAATLETPKETYSLSPVLVGIACLVRTVEEQHDGVVIHRGGELQLVVSTSVEYNTVSSSVLKNLHSRIGHNGVGEGFSAVDRYRIKGHPLVALPNRNNQLA